MAKLSGGMLLDIDQTYIGVTQLAIKDRLTYLPVFKTKAIQESTGWP